MAPFKYKYIAAAGANNVVSATGAYLEGIIVGDAVGSSVIEVSDHASDGDGNVKIYLAGDTIGPGYYSVKATFANGITIDTTNQTHLTVIYK